MKKSILFIPVTLILQIISFSSIAQTDSASMQMNVAPQEVIYSDTATYPPYSSTTSSYQSRETETIRYYSGWQTGNNIIKREEVPLPPESTTNSHY